MLFDSDSYDIIDNNHVLTIKAQDQIAELNRLFARNSKRSVFFNNNAREWIIERYVEGIKDTSNNYGNQILENRAGEYIIQVSYPNIFSKSKLNFCKIKSCALTYPLPQHLGGPLRPYVAEALQQEPLEPTPLLHFSDNLFKASTLFK